MEKSLLSQAAKQLVILPRPSKEGMSISQYAKNCPRPSELLWVWARKLPAKKAQVRATQSSKPCAWPPTPPLVPLLYRAQPKPIQISSKMENAGLEPCNLGQHFFFLMEHIAWEFALRNLSFLDCQWRNGTYLLNLESSRSPHSWAVCEGFDLKAEQAEDSELACWKAEASSLAQEVLDFSMA